MDKIQSPRKFTDIDLSFVPHPITSDLVVVKDTNAIKTAVKNLILTKHYERPFRSEIGSNVSNLLFELKSPVTDILIQKEIENVIQNFEPRVEVIEVLVDNDMDTNDYKIKVTYRILNTLEPLSFDFILKRTR
jgi:phage baseplate assembly protein W